MDVKDTRNTNDTSRVPEDGTQKTGDYQDAYKSAQSYQTDQSVPNPNTTAVFGHTSFAKNAQYGHAQRKSVSHINSANSGNTAYMPTVSTVSFNTGGDSSRTKVPHRAAFIALGIIIAIVAIIYAAGVLIFSDHFYPNTSVGGIDISLLAQDEAVSAIEEVESSYEITVEGEELEFTVTSEDAGVSVDAESIAEQTIQDQNSWLWFMQMWDTHDKTSYLVASSDEGTLGDFITEQIEAFNEDADPSENASITYSVNSGTYVIQDEVYGSQVSADAVIEAVATAITNMESTVQVTDDMLIQPEILSTDELLTAGVDAANAMLTCDVVIMSSTLGIEAGEVDGSVVRDWISFDDSYSPVLDEDAMSTWLSDLVSDYNTVGTTRTYTRGDGTEVTAEGGTYGWTVDTSALVEAVSEAISNGTQGDIEITFSQEGNGYTSAGMDWGAYCDVDLTEQHAYYYDASGNLLWDSGIVSGLPEDDRDTPTGIYYLNSKQTDVTLIGVADENGDPSYESDVEYWMPFVDNMIGLHDASWQPSWVFSDAEAYKTYGSHGCVNLPSDAAAELYEIIQIGDVVIVHW